MRAALGLLLLVGCRQMPTTDVDRTQAVCERWQRVREELGEGTWSGNVEACDPGDMDRDWRERALAQLNLFRFVGGLPPVVTEPVRDTMAQECALMMHAGRGLSHHPGPSWPCFSEAGRDAAARSNIGGRAAVGAVDSLLVDYGSESSLGHRRWLLRENLGPVGIGSTSHRSCFWVSNPNGRDGRQFSAWPPPGPVPIDLFEPVGGLGFGLERTAWSVQSDHLDLFDPRVVVWEEDRQMAVVVRSLESHTGSHFAAAIRPDGWVVRAGANYHVNLWARRGAIRYSFQVVDCSAMD